MRILSIKIKNLASIDGLAEIDFGQEPLCSTGIFAITGPTGAGKSTILDALCLALYARTPRYLQAKENGVELRDVQGSLINQGDVRGILRDGTAEGFAEVRFIGIDAEQYTAGWYVRRARNRPEGSLQSDSMSLVNESRNTPVPGRKTEILREIERVVGLNFEQFTRSVLLAQGDFTAFLKAGRDDKSSLLEKLTGTHIYSEISKTVYQNYKEEEARLTALTQSLGHIELKTEDELAEIRASLDTTRADLKVLEEEIRENRTAGHWYVRLEELSKLHKEADILFVKRGNEFKQAQSRVDLLRLIDATLPTRTWLSEYERIKKELEEHERAERELGTLLHSVQDRLTECSEGLRQALDASETHARELERLEPLIKKAEELDIRISEQEGNVKTRLAEKEDWSAKLDAARKDTDDCNSELLAVKQRMAEHLKWIADKENRRAIAENRQLIQVRLDEARLFPEQLHMFKTQREQLARKLSALRADREAQTSMLTLTGNAKSKTEQELRALRLEIELADKNKLESEKTRLGELQSSLIELREQWRALSAVKADIDRVNGKITQNLAVITGQQALIPELHDKLRQATQKRQESKARLDRNLLIASENISALRGSLLPGEACPVCGSTEHPYVSHQPLADKILQSLEEEFNADQQVCEALTDRLRRLEMSTENLGLEIQEAQRELTSRQSEYSYSLEFWMKTIHELGFAGITELSAEADILEVTARTTEALAGIRQVYQATMELEEKAISLQKTLDNQNIEHIDLDNRIKDIGRNILTDEETSRHLELQERELERKLQSVEEDLSPLFTAAGWFANWRAQPADFLTRISDFAESWQEKHKELEQLSKQAALKEQRLVSISAQKDEYTSMFRKTEQALLAARESLDALKQQRKDLLNGEPTLSVQAAMKQKTKNCEEELQRHKQDQDRLNNSLIQLRARAQSTEQTIGTLRDRQLQLSNQLNAWIDNFNTQGAFEKINTDRLLELSLYPAEFLDSERQAIRSMQDALITAESIVREHEKAVRLHQNLKPTDLGQEELSALLTKKEASRDLLWAGLTEADLLLKQDAENRRKSEEVLHSISIQTKKTDQWGRLNDLIGSSDGKKFRQIAQEYTLDVLLNFANIHLEMLSRRYLIERIPGTLALQVIDQDMGNEVRTVYSLSGGESFLVSLALALGLASLSSNKMKVESLFIDEGFGSLDPLTLNMAMDALERLHNQGRKVGVISHVQEMTERIPVQIRVEKVNAGKSVISINAH